MPNRLTDVDPTVVDAMATLEGAAPQGVLSRVQICLSEALQNLVDHAPTEDASAPIEFHILQDAPLIAVEIFDPVGAPPFDLRQHARSISEIDALAEDGRGLAIILECADEVEYGAPNGHHRLRLTFAKAPASGNET